MASALKATAGRSGASSYEPGDYIVADTLTSGSHPGSNMPGRRREDDTNIVTAFHMLQDPISEEDSTPAWGRGSKNGTASIAVAYPLARRGREGGSELEVGEANVYNALRAGDGGSSRLNQVLTPDAAVRRLTPVECERLQGLPDDWTRVPDSAPDSRRYAGLGDAVTANVGEWIGRRLAA